MPDSPKSEKSAPETMKREEIEAAFKRSFAGVTLGDGVSLRQAQSIDTYGEIPPDDRDPEANIIDDWQRIPFRELERNCIAHLDAEGWRYYLPAFALALLDRYDPGELWTIGTLSSLYPKQQDSERDTYQYSLLNLEQKQTIALYLKHLPSLVNLDKEDVKICQRSQQNYWSQFLEQSILIDRNLPSSPA